MAETYNWFDSDGFMCLCVEGNNYSYTEYSNPDGALVSFYLVFTTESTLIIRGKFVNSRVVITEASEKRFDSDKYRVYVQDGKIQGNVLLRDIWDVFLGIRNQVYIDVGW
jgi:hypothetical protein